MRIEIAGALSCGKSTLAGLLSDAGHEIVYEDLTTNPYLDLRVVDPEKYDYLCQERFVLDKIHSLEKARDEKRAVVADFSLAAERAYVSHYVSHRPDWIVRLESLLDDAEATVGTPDLLVYLRCSPEAQLERIRHRGRSFEQGHDIAFIDTINRLVDIQVTRMRSLGVPVASYRTDIEAWDTILSDLHRSQFPSVGYGMNKAA